MKYLLLASILFVSCDYDKYLYPKNEHRETMKIEITVGDSLTTWVCGNCHRGVYDMDKECWFCKYKFIGVYKQY